MPVPKTFSYTAIGKIRASALFVRLKESIGSILALLCLEVRELEQREKPQ
jgi:hypothetical protein